MCDSMWPVELQCEGNMRCIKLGWTKYDITRHEIHSLPLTGGGWCPHPFLTLQGVKVAHSAGVVLFKWTLTAIKQPQE